MSRSRLVKETQQKMNEQFPEIKTTRLFNTMWTNDPVTGDKGKINVKGKYNGYLGFGGTQVVTVEAIMDGHKTGFTIDAAADRVMIKIDNNTKVMTLTEYLELAMNPRKAFPMFIEMGLPEELIQRNLARMGIQMPDEEEERELYGDEDDDDFEDFSGEGPEEQDFVD